MSQRGGSCGLCGGGEGKRVMIVVVGQENVAVVVVGQQDVVVADRVV